MGGIRQRRPLLGSVRRGRSAVASPAARRHARGLAAASGGVEPSGRHLGSAGRCPRQPRDRGGDGGARSARGGRPAWPSGSPCGRPWSPPRSPGSAVPTGPTPRSSPTRPSCCTPCPTGKAPRCAGSARTRWPTCRCIPVSRPAGNGCAPHRRCCRWTTATNGGSACRARSRSRPGSSCGACRADADQAPSQLSRRISSLLQAPT